MCPFDAETNYAVLTRACGMSILLIGVRIYIYTGGDHGAHNVRRQFAPNPSPGGQLQLGSAPVRIEEGEFLPSTSMVASRFIHGFNQVAVSREQGIILSA